MSEIILTKGLAKIAHILHCHMCTWKTSKSKYCTIPDFFAAKAEVNVFGILSSSLVSKVTVNLTLYINNPGNEQNLKGKKGSQMS